MVNIDMLALTILGINAFLFFLTTKLTGIGKIRGGALSGWISSLIGLWVLVNKGKIPTLGVEKGTFIFVYAVIVIFAILFVFVGRDSVSSYRTPIFGKLLFYIPRIGIFMGIVIAIISQVIA